VISQSGGTNALTLNSATAGLLIGGTQAFPGNGTYSLSGSGALTVTGSGTNGGEVISGIGGAGTFLQSGGFHSITGSTQLVLGQGAGAGTYNLSGGILSVAASAGAGTISEIIGDGGNGNFIQSDGTHTISGTGSFNGGQLILANNTLATATYNLSGGTLNITADTNSFSEIIANSGTAQFIQSGGTHSVARQLVLGFNPSGKGTYNLSGNGTLSADLLVVGNSGAGTFIQSAGTNAASAIELGYNFGSTGAYQLSDSGVINASHGETIGDDGAGTFNQSGGTNNAGNTSVPGGMALGLDDSTSRGNYLLSGSGVLNVYGTEDIGGIGTGIFNQSSGTHTVSGTLFLGGQAVGVGTYTLSGGVLNVEGVEYVGQQGSGSFNQSGGTNTCNNLVVANAGSQNTDSRGYYSLSNGAVLNSVGGQLIGVSGAGTFDQSGGTNTMNGDLEIGANSFGVDTDEGHGTYLLRGNGVLNVHGTVDVGFLGSGVFVQSGGTLTISNGQGLEVGSQFDPSTSDAGQGIATFSGGTCTVNSVSVAGTPSGIGGFGTLSINTAGHLIVSGTLKVWDTGFSLLSLGPGATLSVGSLDLSGNHNLFLWSGGTLQFTASTAEVSSSSPLGPSVSLTGGKTLIPSVGLSILPGASLNVSGGALLAGNANNYGAFSDTSGSASISGVFVNSGTASFGGSQSWGPGSVFVNTAGVATFSSPLNSSGFGPVVVVTGGSVQAATPATLPRLAVSTGKFAMAAGRTNLLRTTELSIDSSGTVDIDDNDMIVDATSLTSVAGYISSAFNNGNWQGSGLTSTHAAAVAADPFNAHKTALGYATASSVGITNFDGQSVSASGVLVRYTYSGDANLDGVVNALDFNAVATNFGGSANSFWFQGDFNYDGVVDTQDFTQLATNFGQVLPSPALGSLVPEPGSFAWLAVALLMRRHRKHLVAKTC
jgi:hypothetical protein